MSGHRDALHDVYGGLASGRLVITGPGLYRELTAALPQGNHGDGSRPSLSDESSTMVGYAGLEAARLRHEYIGSAHLLLGLLRLKEGPAYEFLDHVGADLTRAREAAVRFPRSLPGQGR